MSVLNAVECPDCGTTDVSISDMRFEYNEGEFIVTKRCNNCRKIFTVHYRFIHMEDSFGSVI